MNSNENLEDSTKQIKPTLSLWSKIWPGMFFLLLGIGHAILQKLAFISEADGIDKYGYHTFRKPWWITALTFFGMACGTPVYAIVQCVEEKNGNHWQKITSLTFKEYAEFAIPAFSDAFENIISAVCIAFVGVSIDSMMKSGTLVGVSLITRFVFKRPIPAYKWWSIGVVVLSLIMVGAAGIINSNSSSTITTTPLWTGIIIALKFVSQLGYSVRISYEEYFTQIKGYHPVMICGLEGTWTFIMTALVLMPIVQFIPSQEGNGVHEDTLDTFEMMKNNHSIIIITFFLCAFGLSYNCVSTTLIGRTSAIVRTLMEAFRTFLIWMVQFLAFYSFRTNDKLYHYRLIGEEWENGSYIQLVGFITMTLGILAYNGVPHYPCFKYDQPNANEKSVDDLNNGNKFVDNGESGNKNKKSLNVDLNKLKSKTNDETNDQTTDNTTDITAETLEMHAENNSDLDNISVRSMSIGSSDSDYQNLDDDQNDNNEAQKNKDGVEL
ncbi:hypothetical protein M9Y10_002769 [Tritrichomonas musculus]|uniref:Integral membrane protein n=1 Tax=Tritrichomonas musculus TaxID=1915356 RepID=A0ABR2LAQ9_9EUKA